MQKRFLQLHYLASYPSALLNRDDGGYAKRIPFGGVSRTRISSQCLKRHWRTYNGVHSLSELNLPMSIRSRHTFEEYLLNPMVNEDKIPQNLATVVTKKIIQLVSKGNKEKEKESTKDVITSKQIIILGYPELEFLRKEAVAACKETDNEKEVVEKIKKRLNKKESKENLKALVKAAGLDAALFGRMVTSDIFARGDAAIHVAHAFTVHSESYESDYFTAVDDISQESGELGSAHLNTTELTSGLYYGYVVVDIPLLVSNLEGCEMQEWQSADKELASHIINKLIHLVATVSPGAKLGSTAPYSYASMVMLEYGNEQPRTLANAFLCPVKETPDLLLNTYDALSTHINDLNKMYSRKNETQISGQRIPESLVAAIGIDSVQSLDEIVNWAQTKMKG